MFQCSFINNIIDSYSNITIQSNAKPIVNVYHRKRELYDAELILENTKIFFSESTKHEIERKLGLLGIQIINYYSSNGTVINKKLHILKKDNGFYSYKYLKVKEEK